MIVVEVKKSDKVNSGLVISSVSIIEWEKNLWLPNGDLDIFHEIVDSSTSMAEYNTIQVQTFCKDGAIFYDDKTI